MAHRVSWPALVASLLAVLSWGAHAPSALAQVQACANPNGLGVARTATLNTAEGGIYGNLQYRDNADFLRDGEVVLTFDDGPLPAYTQPVLDALDRHCTKATFFFVGRMALAYPDMVRQAAARGHTIGSHTWSHANIGSGRLFLRGSAEAVTSAAPSPRSIKEMELGFSAVSQALGRPAAPFFRFPYLAHSKANLQHLQKRGIAAFSIDVDSLDYRSKSGGEVTRRVLSLLAQQRKGILLFHDIQPATARALPELLDQLKARGFKVVHMRPAASMVTMAAYDDMARSIGGKRLAIAQERPLVTRTPTWGLTKQVDPPGVATIGGNVPSKGASAGGGLPGPTGSSSAPAASPLPWQANSAPQAVPPAPPPPRPTVTERVPAFRDSISSPTSWHAHVRKAY